MIDVGMDQFVLWLLPDAKKPHDSHIDNFIKSPKFVDSRKTILSHQSEKEMYEPLALLINDIRELHKTSHPHDSPLDLKCIARDELPSVPKALFVNLTWC